MKLLQSFLFLLCLPTVGTTAMAQTVASHAAENVPNTMQARVEACVACHGPQGRGVDNVYFPRLAGKPAGYLYNQLIAFRNGTRKYVPMNYLLEYLPDPYLHQMAQYFAEQNPPLPAPAPVTVSPAVLNLGQTIASAGLPARQIPACIACHGAELGGREPGIPGLLGLRADYISAQLGAWRYGTRTAIAPDCMQFIASSLTESEAAAVSAWLASRPAAANPRPIRQGETHLPLACGSQKIAAGA